MEVDWEETLTDWIPSTGAEQVTDAARIEAIANFCEVVGKTMFDRIEYFDNPLASMKHLQNDRIGKSEVFEYAAKQIRKHKKVWSVQQKARKDHLTYEFPLVVKVDDKIRYMKFQIEEGIQGIASPRKVRKVFLRYHPSGQQIEVKYAEN